ncbi:MAG: TonB-dependent receptor [Bacteroidota bacterium]
MIRFAWLLGALLAAFAPNAHAQSARVEGQITYADEGVPFATVRVVGTEIGTAADVEGRYALVLPGPGTVTLQISAVGYQTEEREVRVDTSSMQRLDIELAPVEVELDRVVVTATRTAKELADVAVPTTVIGAKTIQMQGAQRLGDVLETVPGVVLTDDHGSGLQVQGFSPDYTLILLDGEPVVGRTAGTLDLDRLTVSGIERVEIVEGPSSSLYGSEALAGVVNLVSALPSEGEQARVEVRAGSFGASDATIEAAAGRERWAARGFINRYGSQGYDLTPDAFGPTVPAFSDWTADLRSRLDLGRGATARLGARIATQDQTGAFALGDGDNEIRYDDTGQRLDWSLHPEVYIPLSRQVRLTTTLYGSQYATEVRHRNQTDGTLAYSDDFDQRYAKAEAQLDVLWGAKHLTVAGAGVIDERLAGDRYGPDASGFAPSAQQVFAFAQHEWMPSRRVELNASARFDAHTDYAARLTPKLSVLVRPTETVRLRASLGSGFKAPAFRQLYLAFTNAAAGYSVFGSTRMEEGLRDLEDQGQIAQAFFDVSQLDPIQAESSIALNVGTTFQPTAGVELGLGGFWNEVSDLIETQPVAQKTNGQSVFGYFNLDRIYTRGLTADVTARLLSRLELAAGYQFLQARDREVVDALSEGSVFGRNANGRESRLSLSDYGGLFGRSPHTLSVRATVATENASVSLRSRWRSRYGYRDLDGNSLANRPDEFVSGYAILDLTLTRSWDLPTGRLTTQLGSDNLLDVTRGTLVPSLPGRTLFASLGLSL